MNWPFGRATPGTLAFAGGAGRLPWVHHDAATGALRFGVVDRDQGTDAEQARRWRSSGLSRRAVRALLPLAQTHGLQMPAPAVPAAELREASRWRLADLVDTPPADLALDVMPLGHPGVAAQAGTRQVLVVATAQEQVQRLQADAAALGWELSLVDVAETAQRNLQTAAAAAAGQAGHASAALLRHGSQALLTFCAHGELYQVRRLDLDTLHQTAAPASTDALGMDRADIVDYGAETGDFAATDAPLLLELRRSLDVWERTWPDRPLATLWLGLGSDTASWLPRLRDRLPVPVQVLDPILAFEGGADRVRHESVEAYEAARAIPGTDDTWLPLLGLLLRPSER